MNVTFDDLDRKLLTLLQRDASQSVDQMGDSIGLSRNAVWRRIKRLEESGVIKARVAVLNPERVGLGLSVFISVKTAKHDAKWAAQFLKTVRSMSEILGAYRTAGDRNGLGQITGITRENAKHRPIKSIFQIGFYTDGFIAQTVIQPVK